MKKIVLLSLMLGLLIAGIQSCGTTNHTDCPDIITATVDASKDTTLVFPDCSGLKFNHNAVTVKGYQDNESIYNIYCGPLTLQALKQFNTDNPPYRITKDSAWNNSGWFDAFADTTYIFYKSKQVTKGTLTFTLYYANTKNYEVLEKLPK